MEKNRDQCQDFSPERLLLLAFAEPEEALAREIEAHLEQCPDCREEWEGMLQVKRAAEGAPKDLEPAPEVLRFLQIQARQSIRKSGPVANLPAQLALFLTPMRVAAVAGLVILLVLVTMHIAPPPGGREKQINPYDTTILATELKAIDEEQGYLISGEQLALNEENTALKDELSAIDAELSSLARDNDTDMAADLSAVETEIDEIEQTWWL